MTPPGRQAGKGVPALEWIAGAIGLASLILLLAVIGRDAVVGDSSETPSIVVRQEAIARSGGGYVLTFEAVNQSGGTAAALIVEGQIREGDTVLETSTATMDYVAGHGRAHGGLFFRHDPKMHALTLRPTGYQSP